MATTVDLYSSALNDINKQASAIADPLAYEKELETELYSLRCEHANELAQKKIKQEKELYALMVKQNRVVNEKDYEDQCQAITDLANLYIEKRIEANAELTEEEKKQQIKAIRKKEEEDKKELKKHYDRDLEFYKKALAEKEKLDKKQEKQKAIEKGKELTKEVQNNLFSAGKTLQERKAALEKAFSTENGTGGIGSGLTTLTNALTNALSDFAKQLDSEIESIASRKSTIDTRLQGSRLATSKGSYWDKISSDITGAAAISPYVKQSDIAAQVESMVKSGISYNVEERAFLGAIKDKIADTFEVTNSTLRRLVRIQEQDTTAARLGMESALTSFLNNMYETTEYMSEVASEIKSSIEEASALMTATGAVEFEYQLQKWSGSLYSVGMNRNSVTNIANAIGQLAAGDISGVNSDAGKLLMMAASNSGLSVSDMLSKGLDDSDVNTLMKSVVEYLAQIASETSDSLVVQQQLANVYGLKASDLRAAQNLSSSLGTVSNNGLSYGGAINQLYNMANTMYKRTSIGEMMSNAWANTKYSMAASIANNPATYAIYKAAGLLDQVAGGLEFSLPLFMGTGTAQTFNIANIMRAGALGAGIVESISKMISAGGNGGTTGSGLLNAFGVGASNSVQRGTGSGLITTGGGTTSESGYIGNSSGGDIISKHTADTTSEVQNQISAKQDETEESTTTTIDNHVVEIINLLQSVISGTSTFKVVQQLTTSTSWT